MRRTLVIFILIALVLSGMPAALAAPQEVPPLPLYGGFAGPPPVVTAASWILYDDTYGRVLAEHNADEPRSMASTTKIMTALLALENGDLDAPVRISVRASEVGEAEVDLNAGEIWSLRDLLTAMLVRSANDAAMAVAEAIGGTVEVFVAMMNDRAAALGLTETSFENPHGLDGPGHHTSARDLLNLARVAMENPEFATLVRTRTAVLPPEPDGTARVVQNTNKLLTTYPGAIGVKTGYTNQAGLVLVAAAERDERRLYAVVMGSQNSFADAAALLDYGFEQFGVITVIVEGLTYASRREADETAPLKAETTVTTLAPADAAVVLRTGFEGATPYVAATVEGEDAGRSDLVGDPDGHLPTLREALRWVARYWNWIAHNG